MSLYHVGLIGEAGAVLAEQFSASLRAVLMPLQIADQVVVVGPDQGRIEEQDGTTDWSIDWGFNSDDEVQLQFTTIHASKTSRITIMTEVTVTGNDVITRRYQRFCEAGLDWIGHW